MLNFCHQDSESSDDIFQMIDDDDEDEYYAKTAVFLYGMIHDSQHYNKTMRIRGRESGHEFVVRNVSDPTYCHIMFRMKPKLFHQLHDLLVASYGLESSTKSSSIEALGMFLWMVGTPQPVRQAMTIFGRSLDTVNRNFNKVLESVVMLSAENIKPLDPAFNNIHPRLQLPRFKGLFN